MGKPELEKVMQRRKPDADGRVGPIRPEKNTPKPSTTDELAEQLLKRTQKLEDVRRGEGVRGWGVVVCQRGGTGRELAVRW